MSILLDTVFEGEVCDAVFVCNPHLSPEKLATLGDALSHLSSLLHRKQVVIERLEDITGEVERLMWGKRL